MVVGIIIAVIVVLIVLRAVSAYNGLDHANVIV